MAVSHAAERGAASFAQVLHADGPDTTRATELALYAWLVGRWHMDVTTTLVDIRARRV